MDDLHPLFWHEEHIITLSIRDYYHKDFIGISYNNTDLSLSLSSLTITLGFHTQLLSTQCLFTLYTLNQHYYKNTHQH